MASGTMSAARSISSWRPRRRWSTAHNCCGCYFSSRSLHTRFYCDWSSDVCSSDLYDPLSGLRKTRVKSRTQSPAELQALLLKVAQQLTPAAKSCSDTSPAEVRPLSALQRRQLEIGRASCRERV